MTRPHVSHSYKKVLPQRTTDVRTTPSSNGDSAFGLVKRPNGAYVILLPIKDTDRTQVINVTKWFAFPDLATSFADAVVAYGMNRGSGTRATFVDRLNGFFRFLSAKYTSESTLTLRTLSDSHLRQYALWLESLTTKEGHLLKVATQSQRVGAVRIVINTLRSTDRYRDLVPPGLHVARRPNKAPESSELRKGKFLSNAEWIQIFKQCLADAKEAKERIELGYRIAVDHKPGLPPSPKGSRDYQDYRLCIAALDELFPDRPFTVADVWEHNRPLANAIVRFNPYKRLLPYFFPTASDLVPFVVLFTLRTLFNPDGVLQFAWSSVHPRNWFFGSDVWDLEDNSRERVTLTADKLRANAQQVRSFPTDMNRLDNPCGILAAMELMTRRLRRFAPTEHQDRVFLFYLVTSPNYVRGYEPDTKYRGGDPCWRYALQRYITSRKLPHFNLSMLRSTGVEFADQITGGDLRAIQALTGHRNVATIERHYTAPAAILRGQDRLAVSMAYRDRWIATDRKSEFFGLGKQPGQAAATPGFLCLDPLSSPMPNQRQGRLCTACGECPLCPLAGVLATDPRALAQLITYKQALEASAETLAAERFLKVTQPRLRALNEHWLPAFSKGAWQDVARFQEHCSVPIIE